MFDSLFGGGDDPSKEFAKAMEGYEEMLLGYYQPFMDQTFSQLGTLEQQYAMLLSNPQAIYDMMAGGFESSPGYEYQYNTSMNAQNQAAAAGGQLGGSQHQSYAAQEANALASQDFDKYMQNMTGLYSQGLSGTENLHNLNYTTGFNASSDMARYIGEMMMAEAGIAAQSAQADSNFWGMLGGIGLEGLLGNDDLMSWIGTAVGTAFGGPAGGAAGGAIGSATDDYFFND